MKTNMKKIIGLALVVCAIVSGCTDFAEPPINTSKQSFTYTKATGEFRVTFDDGTDQYGGATIKIYNTSFSTDSLWVEDDFYYTDNTHPTSQVKVAFDGKTSFSVTGGTNQYGNKVNIIGQTFPEQDSIQIQWVYPDDDLTLNAHGRLYNGINN